MANKVNLDQSTRLDITCKRGDTFSLTVTLKDTAGTALALDTDKYRFLIQVRENLEENQTSKGSLVLGTSNVGLRSDNNFEPVSVDDNGNATIQASALTMRSIPSGKYSYDIQYIKPNISGGLDTHRTILFGSFIVNEDISEAVEEREER
tara:strand:- start:565 stop:1014 length:450 start_codon:yes stop_codon:yes gene_type:complete